MFEITILSLTLIIITVFGLLVVAFKRGEIFDLGWALAILVSYYSAFLATKSNYLGLTLILILVWAVKLLTVIFFRIFHFEQDFRYKDIKNHILAGLFQWVSAVIFALPILLDTRNPGVFRAVFWISYTVAAIALVLNSISDFQLLSHRLKGNKTFLASGMWRLCRYPNYFFELVFWFSISISLVNSNQEFFSLLLPIYLYLILRYFSGIAPQERRRLEKYGEEYKLYCNEVPLLFPFLRFK